MANGHQDNQADGYNSTRSRTKMGSIPRRRRVAVWLNEVESEDGKRYFRSITIAPRKYLDDKTGRWEDASSLRVTDLPSLILALQAAQDYVHNTPLPGLPAAGEGEVPDESNGLADGELPT